MRTNTHKRDRFPWPELLLVLAIIILFLQLCPSVRKIILSTLDVRNWQRIAWFYANIGIIFILAGWRFGPALVSDWRRWRQRRAMEGARREKAMRLKEDRERIEGYRQASKRRLW
jgi:hypothetical protein